jgi:iron complex outermembrane receptor protein
MNDTTVNQFGALTEGRDTFSEVTPMISLTRALEPGEWLDSGMFYLRYAEGFLTGGFNTDINLQRDPLLQPLQSYDPEHVDNYEFGFKGTFADGRLRLNTAVFYMDYTDKQDTIIIDNTDSRFIANPNVLEFAVVTNVSAVEIYGLELELRGQPWAGGLISLDVGYLHNEYGEYDSLDDDLNLVDLSKLAITDLSPDWTVNWKIEQTFTLANGATLIPMLGVYWQSEYEWLGGLDRDSPPSFCFQGDYAKWRTRLTYESAAGDYQASLYGNNISDGLFYEHCTEYRGLYLYRHAQPASWGIEFSGRWGG